MATEIRSGSAGKDAVGGLDQNDMDIAQRIDVVQAVSQDGANRAVQFGGKFRPGGASTDDCNVQLTLGGPVRLEHWRAGRR